MNYWQFKNCIQKIFKGFNDIELMDLDHEIAKFTLPRIKRYRQLVREFPAYPTEFNSIDEWIDVLDHIVYFIEQKVIDPSFDNVDMYRYEKGRELFGLYFDNLWH